MSYKKALNIIKKYYNIKTERTLDRMITLSNYFNNPNKNLKIVHVAGTNGKGSISNMIARILYEKKLRVGLFTSPHLINMGERIQINFHCISDRDLYYYARIMDNAVKKLKLKINFFEFLTMIAYKYFCDRGCDIVVMETGMGGEFDATNIVQKPLASVITNIGLDHEQILGKGIKNIARAKSGIIKKESPTILYDLDNKTAKNIFEKKAKKLDSKIYYAKSNKVIFRVSSNLSPKTFDYKNIKNIKLSLLGINQVYNAITAIETCFALNDIGYKISTRNIKEGLKKVVWSGRFELMTKTNERPLIFLDGGHNVQCMKMLVRNLCDILGNEKVVFVVGALNDKDINNIAKTLSKISKAFVLTSVNTLSKLKKSINKKSIIEAFKKYNPNCFYINDILTSIEKAKLLSEKKHPICITGSLYLAGDVLKSYKQNH